MVLRHPWRATCVFLFLVSEAAYGSSTSSTDTAEAVHWIQANAIPFATADVVEDMSDLECLHELIGDARIVGLGEQTHGTSEFQTMKHRIIRFLVEEMGFTAVILEASWGGGLYADRYVVEDKGSYAGTANALGFWFFRNPEFRSFIDWLHDYNREASQQSIHLTSMDYVSPHDALVWCNNILSSAGITPNPVTVRDLERMPSLYAKIYRGTNEERETYFNHCHVVLDEILSQLPAAQSRLTVMETETILHVSRVLDQLEGRFEIDLTSSSIPFNYRDRCMAENVSWWLDVLGEDAKVIVWAHNGHIATDWAELDLDPVGENLRQTYGEDYVSVGFSTCEGSFSAYSPATGDIERFPLPSPPSNSFESVLCAAGISNGFIDLRTLEPGTPAEVWMSQPRTFKSFGNSAEIVDGEVAYAYYFEQTLPNMFDVLIHIHRTSELH